MTPLQIFAELERIRRELRLLATGAIMAWTVGALAVVLLLATVLRITVGQPSHGSALAVAALVAACVGAWRWRAVRPDRLQPLDAALWAESQAPALRYSLVTLAEQAHAREMGNVQAQLAAFASRTSWSAEVQAALRQRRVRIATRLVGGLVVAALAAYPWPGRTALARVPSAARTLVERVAAPAGRVKAELTLLAPAYSGRTARSVAFGETVSALVGSIIRIDGAGAGERATLLVQESSESGAGVPRPVNRAPRGDGWRGDVRLGASPIALRLRDAVGERWLLVTPVADSSPVATLLLPSADTLVLDTTARIPLRGTVHDDIALRDSRVEYIISSGGGEQFTFKSGVLDARRGALGRNITVATTLDLGALGLKPGDLMHVRLTAHDGNTLSGPSLGSSETRTIRIPRVDERDSVSVEQLPPTPVDKSVLSQRQLLLLTERLVARMPRIERATIVAESNRIGIDQARLRKQVADIVFARLGDSPSGEHAHFAGDGHEHTPTDLAAQSTPESVLQAADRATGGMSGMLDSHGDETPVVAVNRPLLEAYNAMWDATRALQGGVPRDALAPMRRALAAIQRARSAERVYLRGTPPAAVIDIEKIRLIGTDSAKYDARRALAALPAPERRIAERVLRGMALLQSSDASALDSLRLVRLDALGSAPALASALGDAVDAVERGRDATDALLRARRLALAPWQRSGGNLLWLGGAP
ncbi:MAG TPA: hypothetical protein VE861_14255 [Gemmatimonadaceae bacterium]|nr:hypothetical protein [Gemmatimonadaceae bacterium]